MSRLLVVDDDLRSARVIAELLRRSGYSVDVAGGGAEALERVRSEPPDLMVLDYEMPGADEAYSFEIGAVDYVRKGGDTAVLISRIGAAIRRHRPSSSYLRRGRLLVDTVDDRAWLGGRELRLEHRPLQVLKYLMQKNGAIVDKTELLERFWGSGYAGLAHSVEQAVWAIRKELGEPGWIETGHRRGYRLATQC